MVSVAFSPTDADLDKIKADLVVTENGKQLDETHVVINDDSTILAIFEPTATGQTTIKFCLKSHPDITLAVTNDVIDDGAGIPVTSIFPKDEEVTLNVGETKSIQFGFEPENATPPILDTSNVAQSGLISTTQLGTVIKLNAGNEAKEGTLTGYVTALPDVKADVAIKVIDPTAASQTE